MSIFRLLVIEKQNTFSKILSEMGYLTLTLPESKRNDIASNIKDFAPDAILIDLNLNEKDVAFANELKQKNNLPVLFLLFPEDLDFVRKTISGPMFSYVTKPFEKYNLGTIIELTISKFKNESVIVKRDSMLIETQKLGKLGHWKLDLVENKLEWSDEIYRIFNLDPKKFAPSYETFLETIYPDDRDMVNEAYTQSLKTKEPYEITHRLKTISGEIKYVLEKCFTTFDQNGSPLVSIGTVQDISERIENEKLLQKILEISSADSSDSFFQNISLFLCEEFNVDFSLIGMYKDGSTIETLGIANKSSIINNLTYNVVDGPCEFKNNKQTEVVMENALSIFPKSDLLDKLGCNSYIGKVLVDSYGNNIGVICLLNKTKLNIDIAHSGLIINLLEQRTIAEITRYNSEKKLVESEELFRTIGENSPSIILKINKELDIVYANRGVYKSVNEITNSNISNYFHGNNLKLVKEKIADTINNKKANTFTIDQFLDDNTRTFHNVIAPLIEDGEVSSVIFHTTDITESKKSKETSLLLQSLLNKITSSIIISNPYTSEIIELNENAVGTLNKKRGKILRTKLIDLDFWKQMDQKWEYFSIKTIETGSHIFESKIVNPNESLSYVEIKTDYICINNNEYFVTFITDITERINRDADLIQREEKFRTIFQNSTDEIYMINSETIELVDLNNTAIQNLGYSKKELILNPDNTISKQLKTKLLNRNKEQIKELSIFFERKNGTKYPITLTVNKIKINNSSYLLAVGNDKTEQIKIERRNHVINNISHAISGNYELSDFLKRVYDELRIAIPEIQNFSLYTYIESNLTLKKEFAIVENKINDSTLGIRSSGIGLPEFVAKNNQEILLFGDGVLSFVLEHDLTIYEQIPKCWMGVPIIFEGRVNGVLTVSNYHDENSFGKSDLDLISFVAFQIGSFTQRKIYEAQLITTEERYRKITNNLPLSMVTINQEGIIVSTNKKMEEDLGYEQDSLLGNQIDILFPESLNKYNHNQLMTSYFSSKEVRDKANLKRQIAVKNKKGDNIPMEITLNYFIDSTSNKFTIALLKNLSTQEEAEKKLREKDILLKEIHHRVKNNMQIISSLLALQSNKFNDEDILEKYEISQSRIRTMALVHEQLYQSKSLSLISTKSYISELLNFLESIHNKHNNVILESTIEDLELDIDNAIPIGLIVNEIISNSYKHAFSESDNGKINVNFFKDSQTCTLIISDNGKGIENIEMIEKSNSLGYRLIKSLSKQIRADLVIDIDNGIAYTLNISL